MRSRFRDRRGRAVVAAFACRAFATGARAGRRCGRGLAAAALAIAVLLTGPAARAANALRVCADPNNLPFSNSAGEGFENRLAEIVAAELGLRVEYTWWAQRRGFLRSTLNAGLCDVVVGVPSALDMLLVTAPYYRSIYVFVSAPGIAPPLRSLDDARLRTLRIGVQMVGDDGSNTPPAHALARRGITGNVRGYMLYGDYAEPSPPSRIVRAVADGEVEAAIVWGPLAGYFAARMPGPLVLAAVEPEVDQPFLPFAFDISMGVRRGDEALRDRLDAVLLRRRDDIDRLLADYGVPRVDRAAARSVDVPATPRPEPSATSETSTSAMSAISAPTASAAGASR